MRLGTPKPGVNFRRIRLGVLELGDKGKEGRGREMQSSSVQLFRTLQLSSKGWTGFRLLLLLPYFLLPIDYCHERRNFTLNLNLFDNN
jgi:hypothetical protein